MLQLIYTDLVAGTAENTSNKKPGRTQTMKE